MLYSSVPRSSQSPAIWTATALFRFSQSAWVSRVERASSRMTAWSKSKKILSAAPLANGSRMDIAPEPVVVLEVSVLDDEQAANMLTARKAPRILLYIRIYLSQT